MGTNSRSAGVRDIYVQANGLRHHLLARGAPGAPVVLMVHGLTQQAHVFDAIAARLAAKYHVYCLDVRGRGETEWGAPDGYHVDNYVADLEAVREALGLERFSLVGTSMGGLISMQYAPKYPQRVGKVVLNDIGPEIAPEGLQRILRTTGSAPEGFPDLKAVVKYYRDENPAVLARRSDEEVLEYARWHVRKNDMGVYVWKMDPAVRKPPGPPPAPETAPWDAFRAISCPVLIVRGGTSDILSAEGVAKMLEAKPGARLVEVPGVGHAPSLAEPEAVSALETFLAS
ncbi:MAG: alpha/beta hydrolase [Dehalococcoidia bacterium]|nr:alpha/beta hydrolase [Dehalococcoidia bacterium]